jgi:hypothetical protein
MATGASIDIGATANEVFTIARCLFAFDPAQAEERYAHLLARQADPILAARFVGRYVQRDTGYIHIQEGGVEGEFLSELPNGVGPQDVIEDPFDVTGRTPLQDHLRTLAAALRDAPGVARSEGLAKDVETIVGACAPACSQEVFADVKRRAAEIVFDPGPQEGGIVAAAEQFLTELEGIVGWLRAQPSAGGMLLGAMLALVELTRASAARHDGTSPSRAASFGEALGYVAAAGPMPAHEVAQAFSARLVRDGRGAAVRNATETLKARGDELIETALDAGLNGFYPPLFAAASYEAAAWLIAGAAAEAEGDKAVRRRWGKLAANAEERMVRISDSMEFSVRNLYGDGDRFDRERIVAIRAAEGEAAARLFAINRIAQLIYPRCALPILLGEVSAETA